MSRLCHTYSGTSRSDSRPPLLTNCAGLVLSIYHLEGRAGRFYDMAFSRFWDSVDKSGDCWVWTGKLTDAGYGHFWVKGERRAHRHAWALTYGSIPAGMCVLHRCDNRPCVRPDHLFLGTVADNNADMTAKGRNARGLKSGPYTKPESVRKGSRHHKAKLTEELVAAMRVLYLSGEVSCAELGRRHGVHSSTAARAILGQRWKHVNSSDKSTAYGRRIQARGPDGRYV